MEGIRRKQQMIYRRLYCHVEGLEKLTLRRGNAVSHFFQQLIHWAEEIAKERTLICTVVQNINNFEPLIW